MEEKSSGLVNKSQKCCIQDRKKVELTGIRSVVSFDTDEVLLETHLGGLLMKGSDLHINKLDLDRGVVDVDGKIDALIYSDKSPTEGTAKGIMSRLFR